MFFSQQLTKGSSELKNVVLSCPPLESEVCVESETGPEDTVSLASTITSDTDVIHTKVKSKPIKTTFNLTQTRLV